MKNALSLFMPAIKELVADKVNFLLAIIPVLIGGLIYYFAGSWFYRRVMSFGQETINEYIAEGNLNAFFYYMIATIVSILLFLFVNWTFVLVISVVASPFNDLLSARIEKRAQGLPEGSGKSSWGHMFQNFFYTIFNESKKILLILLLSGMAFILGYIPLLTPISLVLTFLLLAVNYIDYSWSRNDMPPRECFKDVRGSFLAYSTGGVFFFFLVSIPLLNLLVAPFATSYFTLLWLKNNEHRYKVTQHA